ncbi:exodeoxyribonuclease VII large subunit [Lentibacillus sp. CBA3610]|uniref:exodeoxyribonuclease VII large subunit n=1 Tax=Lentibacillus sp. CBA3610 TaxID=2518176 RepID=UPI001595BA1F|nr:exodeoxyribonuclease VII large subunit [Lentibacillus sp. CBA3610]QKY69294.1 exodeoxyribonuclease VII large subunit [Lentibacillus sp. CBA3610]
MEDKYLTVTALTKYIKRKFTTDPHLKNIWLKGEISNFKHHSRGHMYLTIKDDHARIQAVMFAGNNRRLKFQPENGMNVLVRGEIGVFEQFGQYQLYIQQMEPDGIGSLYLAFEQLKEKLHKQGYFDKQYKKELPKFPEHIGIITSSTGAAVRDIITTIKRRYPIVQTTTIPALVQGVNAPASIADAINTANQQTSCDVLIVGRGGGSIEELWSFNEEIVAKAIFNSTIPIISAVGHETDITISDYAADVRAPTPTGAAEIAVPSQLELLEKLSNLQRSLTRIISEQTATSRQNLNRMKQSYAFRYPEQLIVQKEQELDKHVERLEKAFNHEWRRKHELLTHLNSRLEALHPNRQIDRTAKELKQLNKQVNYVMTKQVEQNRDRLQNAIEKLTLLNPLETMKRGYAITYSVSGKLLKSVQHAAVSDEIAVRLSDGKLECRVLDIKEDNNGRGE